MKQRSFCNTFFLLVMMCCLSLWGCGGSATRYDPGAPAQVAGLTATPGSGQVALNWSTASKAAGYVIYYSTTSGVTKSTGTKFATTLSTSAIVTGLTNGQSYYFVVTAINSTSESAESNQVAATPSSARSFSQSDLTGDWNFNILVSGTNAKWMRGKLTVNASGTVTFDSFLDSAGGSAPPSGLFPGLFVDSVGQVLDVASGSAAFRGVMAANQYKDIIVGSATGGSSPMLIILQKQVSGITFANGDLAGFGSTLGGPRRFIYDQIASGLGQEWEYAAGQIGTDRKVQYTTFSAPSAPSLPGSKATLLNIDGNGIVTEIAQSGITPQPKVLIDRGVMSADKSLIVAAATDSTGASPKYVLRIYQIINIFGPDSNVFALSDLEGSYNVSRFNVGASVFSAYASLVIDASGAGQFTSYLDSSGSTTLPSGFTLGIVSSTGALSNSADSTLHGKLSYYKDLMVFTRTDSTGGYGYYIALK